MKPEQTPRKPASRQSQIQRQAWGDRHREQTREALARTVTPRALKFTRELDLADRLRALEETAYILRTQIHALYQRTDLLLGERAEEKRAKGAAA